MPATTTSTRGILEPEAGRARFVLTRHAPSADLAAWVERHWVVRWDLRGAPAFTQAILPHPCVNLVAEPGLVAVHGIPLGVSHHRLEAVGRAVGTKFRPGGFAAFAGRPASALNDRVVAPGELFGAPGARLARALAAAADVEDHVAAVEGFLRARRPAPDARYDLVRAVVTAMLSAPPGTTVAALADGHGVPVRTLQRRFRDHVGVGPKWVLKRYRVHEAAERLATGEGEDGAALAVELGYADQSHFTRDFTAQVGRPPGAYARACAAAAGRATPARAA